MEELGSAGLIDDSSIDSSIFGTSKFFREQSDKKKDNIYSDIDKTLEDTQNNDK